MMHISPWWWAKCKTVGVNVAPSHPPTPWWLWRPCEVHDTSLRWLECVMGSMVLQEAAIRGRTGARVLHAGHAEHLETSFCVPATAFENAVLQSSHWVLWPFSGTFANKINCILIKVSFYVRTSKITFILLPVRRAAFERTTQIHEVRLSEGRADIRSEAAHHRASTQSSPSIRTSGACADVLSRLQREHLSLFRDTKLFNSSPTSFISSR